MQEQRAGNAATRSIDTAVTKIGSDPIVTGMVSRARNGVIAAAAADVMMIKTEETGREHIEAVPENIAVGRGKSMDPPPSAAVAGRPDPCRRRPAEWELHPRSGSAERGKRSFESWIEILELFLLTI